MAAVRAWAPNGHKMVQVDIPGPVAGASKSWRKTLAAVDLSGDKGYALVGEWLQSGARYRIPAGALIVGYDRTPESHDVTVWVVGEDLTAVKRIRRTGSTWAGPGTIKALARLLAEYPWPGGRVGRVVEPDRNRYIGRCHDCGVHLDPGAGVIVQLISSNVERRVMLVRCAGPCVKVAL